VLWLEKQTTQVATVLAGKKKKDIQDCEADCNLIEVLLL